MKGFALGFVLGAMLLLLDSHTTAQDSVLPPIFLKGNAVSPDAGAAAALEILEVRGEWILVTPKQEGRGLSKRIGGGEPVPRWLHAPTGTIWFGESGR